MKKLLLTLICLLPLIAFGQTKWWVDTLEVTSPLNGIVYWPDATGDISAYPSSCTISTIDLSDTVTVDFGKSNNVLTRTTNGSVLTTPFSGIVHDSLPYVFIASSHLVETNNGTTIDTTYEQTFDFPDPFLALRPSYKVTTHQDTTFTLIIRWIFAK